MVRLMVEFILQPEKVWQLPKIKQIYKDACEDGTSILPMFSFFGFVFHVVPLFSQSWDFKLDSDLQFLFKPQVFFKKPCTPYKLFFNLKYNFVYEKNFNRVLRKKLSYYLKLFNFLKPSQKNLKYSFTYQFFINILLFFL